MAASADPAHSSRVVFPTSESPSRTAAQLHPPSQIRPFRRISMPSCPSALHRNSVLSVSSLDSLAGSEESRLGVAISVSNPNIRLAKPVLVNGGRSQPLALESPKRQSARHSTRARPANDAKALKRKQVIDEFNATEGSYVNGLDLIYYHFLTPVITSLETPTPLLDRDSLTSLFSNFVDIWNLHRSFFSALTEHFKLQPPGASPLASLLLSHFPYLSLYTPFITAFPSMISTLTNLTTPASQHRPNTHYNHTFATFILTQELDQRCGKLKLRDWLLTIVQRCPRYSLLLRDLIKYTEEEDPEYKKLESALALVNKITSTLDTSLHTHAQIQSLLAVQRSTSGLPFPLIEPGRTLLIRGPLLQIESKSAPREREFLLFSDCIIWLANEETEGAWNLAWSASNANGSTPNSPVRSTIFQNKGERRMGSSDTDDSVEVSPASHEEQPNKVHPPVRKSMHLPPPVPRRPGSTGEDRWIFKGRASLVDVEVTVVSSREIGDERRFEVLSPEGSFVLYASSEDERDCWVSEIRQAKAQRLASLNMTNPNSTLTSSSSTNHVRRSLQALPFPPSDDRIATIRARQNVNEVIEVSRPENEKANSRDRAFKPSERRKKIDHWVPAIWIPDEKTELCMRCGKPFNWRRRRHHCRLCGRCVCAACSGRTFFIADPNAKGISSNPARSCEACYETVFPLVDPLPGSASSANSSSFLSSTFLSSSTSMLSQPSSNDTISSLSKLPSWLSMPSLPTSSSQPQTLMFDMDLNSNKENTPDAAGPSQGPDSGTPVTNGHELEEGRRRRIRLKPNSRPRSYHQILEDFQNVQPGRHYEASHFPLNLLIDSAIEERSESTASEGGEGNADSGTEGVELPSTALPSMNKVSQTPTPSPRRRREDTARRSKRFSLPAIALHTANVTTRTTSVSSGSGSGSGGNGNSRKSGNEAVSAGNERETKANESGAMGRLRRLSLVPGART